MARFLGTKTKPNVETAPHIAAAQLVDHIFYPEGGRTIHRILQLHSHGACFEDCWRQHSIRLTEQLVIRFDGLLDFLSVV